MASLATSLMDWNDLRRETQSHNREGSESDLQPLIFPPAGGHLHLYSETWNARVFSSLALVTVIKLMDGLS